jgi:hypothetical protein
MLALNIKHKTALPSERLILLHIKRCDSCSVSLQPSAALHHADVLQDVLRILIVVLMATYTLEDGPSMFDGQSVCMRHESRQAQARAIARQQLQEGGCHALFVTFPRLLRLPSVH